MAKILIVDDEGVNLRLMGEIICSLGHEVFLARDGKGAIQKTLEISPDLILLDIMMPGMDGFEVAVRLKKDENTKIIPIVMVTALKDVEARVRALDAGADDFLSKPVESTEVRARIRSLLKVKTHSEIRKNLSINFEVIFGDGIS